MNYYDILGVTMDATLETIENAKERLKFGGPGDRVQFSMWPQIDEAYSVLSDPVKRAEYDKKIRKIETSIPPKKSDLPVTLPISEKTKELEIIPKLKRIGKELVLALPTGIIATVSIIKKIRNNYKLVQDSDEKQIDDVKTEETLLDEEYRKKLEERIDKIIDEYHFNYDLKIEEARCENYIELLKKKIELKENENVKKGGLLKYKLQLTSLRRQLQSFLKTLDNIRKKIEANTKKQKLSKIYEKISDVETRIVLNEGKTILLKKLNAKKLHFLEKKKLKVDKIKSRTMYFAIFKHSFISARAVTENFVDNLFVPIEQVDQKSLQIK